MPSIKVTEDNRQTIIESLLNDDAYHIEFNGHLTNHVKHAVVALSGLGASASVIKAYYENYARLTPYGYGLEPARGSKYTITKTNWTTYLGQRTSYSSYYEFFDQEEKELGKDELLKRYLPLLLPGWTGSLTHAAIHLGWALDINNRCMMIEGLAYMAFSYVSCHPERGQKTIIHSDSSVLDSLVRIAKEWENQQETLPQKIEHLIDKPLEENETIHPELYRSGLQFRIAKMLLAGHPLMYETPAWIENEKISVIWQQLHYVITLMYMAEPGDFLVLHFITSLHAMEQFKHWLPEEQQRDIIKCFWTGTLGILFSRATFFSSAKLQALDAQYKNKIDGVDQLIESDWENIINNSFKEEEEHNPKMVYVLRLMWNRSGYYSIFRLAARYFTTTPMLPKSFEIPPVIS